MIKVDRGYYLRFRVDNQPMSILVRAIDSGKAIDVAAEYFVWCYGIGRGKILFDELISSQDIIYDDSAPVDP